MVILLDNYFKDFCSVNIYFDDHILELIEIFDYKKFIEKEFFFMSFTVYWMTANLWDVVGFC